MDGADLILTTPVTPPDPLGKAGSGEIAGATGKVRTAGVKSAGAKKTEQMAKDFESVLLTKVLEEMQNTVSQFSTEEEPGSEQVKGMFTLFLARDVADKGGLGLWKDLKRFFTDLQNQDTQAKSLDEKL
jgi:Rod binding domain-containing protein